MSRPLNAPRLTRLEMHGFKSFATRTVFAFEPGITAVVGPNGSGKSNVADAVRWVLGEQSHGALRSKRTEDVIFAGGNGRSQVGMAEVAVTFDNGAGWLPIAFTEVTVTRRAFRSGENHYLINGRRVRLKDVAHLTASLGQSHTVVGQGLVDAALSQRADERRALFEHAADLTGLRLKATEAERSLNETEANSDRLTDLLGELEPRLKTLERAARQAREWQGLRDRLLALQRTHYRALLMAATDRLAGTEEAAAVGDAAVRDARATLDRLVGDGQAARTMAETERAALARHDASLGALNDQSRRVGHERDLTAERLAALARRRDDMADTRAGLDERRANVVAELATLADDGTVLEAETATARRTVEALQSAGAAARQARTRHDQRAAALATSLADEERRLADIERRRALLDGRRETSAADRERMATAIAERAIRIASLADELRTFAEAEQTTEDALTAADARAAALGAATERATAAAQSARDAVTDAERRLGQATTRLEVLQRLHESGAGLYAGVRATVQAARSGTLTGVRGTVAELIAAPAHLDTAIEVALGGHLQDIVVARWADAEAAIAHLKRTGAGRATFQPLDTIRGQGGGRGSRALPNNVLSAPGVRGVAADLVTAAPDLGAVIGALLGRVLVVDDLAAARAALPALPTGWSAVTLGGEIARTGGSVTGGAAVRESGVLTRERELRELPREIRRLEDVREEAVTAADMAAREPSRLAAERQAVDAERAGQVAARKERQVQRARLAGWLTDLRAEQTVAERRLASLVEASATAERDAAVLAAEHSELTERIGSVRAEHATVLADVSRQRDEAAAGERGLAVAQRRLATLDERLRAERRRHAGLLTQERALTDELALRTERAAALDGERAALAAQHERLTRQADVLATARQTAAAEQAPLRLALRQADADATRLARATDAARTRLLETERAFGASTLNVERARGDLHTLRQRITDDLDLAEPESLLNDLTDDHTLAQPLSPQSSVLSPEEAIARLKERLRRVGYVGEDAVAEFEREAERQAFLREQLADVQGAAASLRALLADLQTTMRTRFDATFAKVADAFAEAFMTLFGGGSARLVLTGGENGSGPGIDIVAQPPGKRLQSLALLSGGERALTAAALLFAILRVNPTPFCLLDEVDAALDEANVVRFRERLRALAAETQVIVVTHNRGTIETADTLYGVTMGNDGVSQVLSLRVAEMVPG